MEASLIPHEPPNMFAPGPSLLLLPMLLLLFFPLNAAGVILIDTANLDPKVGKATEKDEAVVKRLLATWEGTAQNPS